MKKLLCALCVLFGLNAVAVDRITATMTFTNATQTGYTLTVNGNVRNWTNQVFQSGTQIITNSDVTGCGSKTNAFNQISLNLFSQVTPLDTGSNTFQLSAPCGVALVVTITDPYAKVSYSTQVCSTATPVGVPFASYYPPLATRSNVASGLEADLLAYTTNNSILDKAKTQTVTGTKTFSSASGLWNGIISQLADAANLFRGGYWSNGIIDHAISTNLVNYGNAFSSPGSGSFSEQFGNGAVASGSGALAIGPSGPTASGDNTTVVGNDAFANHDSGTAIGAHASAIAASATAGGLSALASGFQSTSFGYNAQASGTNASSFGANTSASYNNSTAVGTSAATTATNQVMLGSPGINTVVQNNLTVQTNATVGGSLVVSGGENILGLQTNAAFTGTNNFPPGADIAFGRFAISSLANGNNAGVIVGTNVFCEVSGPSGAFTINGIAGGRDGKYLIILNKTGFDMTIANASGTDPVAANRIITMTGADRATTGNGAATLIYSASESRWQLISFDP